MRKLAAIAVVALLCTPLMFAQRQPLRPPAPPRPGEVVNAVQSELEKLGMGNPFWTHPRGDGGTVPCTHMVAQHREGDPIMAPCTHLKPEHPDGHDTGVTAPCTHLDRNGRPQHGAHPVMAPCPHIKPEHLAGHDTGRKAPCVHRVAEHAQGHDGPWLPCVHPVALVRTDAETGIKFYTDDRRIQAEAVRIARWLKQRGTDLNVAVAPGPAQGALPRPNLRARPLHVFTRPPVNGDPNDNKDPMWSHYNPSYHSIQVFTTGNNDPIMTLRHEVGHAMLGHSHVQIFSKGGPHTLKDASDQGLAMSEGWAHFVRIALAFDRSERRPMYSNLDWENAMAAGDIAVTQNNEFRVGCVLWDLYDTNRDGSDNVALDFEDLFRVYSATLGTMSNGPIIPSLDDYLDRLIKNRPDDKAAILRVKEMNLPSK